MPSSNEVDVKVINRLTSIGSIINHNPEALFKAFLLGNELGSVKKTVKNLG